VLQLTTEMQDAVDREEWDALPQLQQQRNIFIAELAECSRSSAEGKLLERLYQTNQQLVGTMKKKLKHTSVMASQAKRGGRATRAYLAV